MSVEHNNNKDGYRTANFRRSQHFGSIKKSNPHEKKVTLHMLCVFLQSTRRESFSLDLEMVSLTFSKISFCTRQLSKFRGLLRRSPSLDTAVRHAQYVFLPCPIHHDIKKSVISLIPPPLSPYFFTYFYVKSPCCDHWTCELSSSPVNQWAVKNYNIPRFLRFQNH